MDRTATIILAALAVAGCSRTTVAPDGSRVTQSANSTTVENDQGKATFNQDGKTMDYKGKDGSTATYDSSGKMVATDKDGNTTAVNVSITEAELGVPFYPDSTETPGGMTASQGEKKTVLSARETSDPAAKVIEFYVGKLGKPETTTTVGNMAMANWDKPHHVSVMATTADGKTTIQVTTEH